MVLHDVAPDGHVLLARNSVRAGMMVRSPGEAAERDLTWHDFSNVSDLSADGRWLLFSESGEAGGERYGVYLRRTDGSPAVRLGEGRALALSPDAGWAVSIPLDPPSRLLLLPTHAGTLRTLANPAIAQYQWATFFPDGKRLLVLGNDASGALRLFVQDIDGGAARPITPPGVATRTNTISPDGTRLVAVALASPGEPAIYPIDGGPPVPLPAAASGEEAIRWGADGHSILLASDAHPGVRVSRLDLATGVKQLVRELKPSDTTGFIEVAGGVVSADGTAYAYTDRRTLSDLYVVDGIR
jgi:Tol biopolymer transport system component